jgi:hypothetical protein
LGSDALAVAGVVEVAAVAGVDAGVGAVVP